MRKVFMSDLRHLLFGRKPGAGKIWRRYMCVAILYGITAAGVIDLVARVLHIRQKENTVYKWFSRRAIKGSSLARNIRKRSRNLLHNTNKMKNKLDKLFPHPCEDHSDSAML